MAGPMPMLRTALPVTSPWQESLEMRRVWRDEDRTAGRRGIHERRADEVMLWDFDLRGEAERYVDRCTGSDHGDPREALVRLIAIAGAAIDAMGRLD